MSGKKEFELIYKDGKKIFLSKNEVVKELSRGKESCDLSNLDNLSLQELAHKIISYSYHKGTIFYDVSVAQINSDEETEKNNILNNLYVIQNASYSALCSTELEEIVDVRDLIHIYTTVSREIERRECRMVGDNYKKKIANYKNFIDSVISLRNKLIEISEEFDFDSLSGGNDHLKLIDFISYFLITEK